MWLLVPPAERFFRPEELEIVRALFAEIIPGDPARGIPGAVEADAAEFVNRLLAMTPEIYEEIPLWQSRYRDGLPRLDAEARARYSRSIPELGSEERIALLRGLEAGELSQLGDAAVQKDLFVTLRRHCIQGCFADPRWGGNKEGIIWRWFGYLRPAENLQSLPMAAENVQ